MPSIALADDHHLIRNALVELINQFADFQVVFDVANGRDFITQVQLHGAPDIALLDINMPIMDGFATTEYLHEHYPHLKIMALSVDDKEETIIRMLRLGAGGYLLKDTDTAEFELALTELLTKGYYHNDLVSNTLLNQLKPKHMNTSNTLNFQAREHEFIQLACTELTYKEIADRMCLSPRTVDGYRESLFEKLEVKSRVGLVLFAIKRGLVAV